MSITMAEMATEKHPNCGEGESERGGSLNFRSLAPSSDVIDFELVRAVLDTRALTGYNLQQHILRVGSYQTRPMRSKLNLHSV